MAVDITTEIEIARPRDSVAEFAIDPDNATQWYRNIKAVEWRTPRPLAVGSQVAFVASFLGRRMEYTYEVVDLAPAERLTMRSADGPFPMETTYAWTTTARETTKMTLRNRGQPSGFARVGARALAAAMTRANRKDLLTLKQILERQT